VMPSATSYFAVLRLNPNSHNHCITVSGGASKCTEYAP
jgi:hypothetical protein